ncbi:MAG TPA: hypothetical protein P5096_02450 [Patescibacteria group bacterium]|nr:hypothetical protein [Patescibacteria group bacterium]
MASKKKTVTKTKVSTRTVVLIITGLVAVGGLAYAVYMVNGNSRATQECVNSCLGYQDTDPQYVDICQKSCRTGEVVIYDAAPIENLDIINSDSIIIDTTVDDSLIPLDETVEPVIDARENSEVVQ